jgi:putative acetyltransferase
VSPDFSIRPPQQTDRSAIRSVLSSAFRRDAEAILVEKLTQAGAIKTELVAEENGAVIGYCAFSEVTADPMMDGILLGLAPLAVLNERQGNGAGKALTMRGLEICRQQNAALIVVLGEPDYYSRFGFQPASDHNIKWAAMDAGAAFQLIDFGGITSNVYHAINYHPAFSEV